MEIQNCSFHNNSASVEGGVISFNAYWPKFINSTFLDNYAPYGPIIGSYPVEIRLSTSKLEVASGQPINESIQVDLLDSEGLLNVNHSWDWKLTNSG